ILFSKLPRLDSLEMYACELHTLPKEIALLTHLRSLNLSMNKISFVDPGIGQLTSLRELNLSSNAITNLPEEIGNLAALEQFSMNSNDLSILPARICKLSRLQKLDLTYNKVQALPSGFAHLTALKELGLFGNELHTLPPGFGLLKLEQLYLGGFRTELKPFPAELFQMTSLLHLGLYDMVLDSFPASVNQLVQLESIGLRNLEFFNWKDGLRKLSTVPKLHKVMVDVQRYGNMTPELALLTNTDTLEITTGTHCYQAMQYVSQLTRLTKLEFKYYSDTLLPPETGQLHNLRGLYLDNSKLFELPPQIALLQNLEELKVSANWSQSIAIPKETGKLNKLK
ncbi:MAG TPA: leucine-rich repeat domain-containing protein, partial [Bacteroidia bacterium]|nr:leucine-rich repeat domain-containing protein [Bacteroidia bacterium]